MLRMRMTATFNSYKYHTAQVRFFSLFSACFSKYRICKEGRKEGILAYTTYKMNLNWSIIKTVQEHQIKSIAV